MLDSVRVFYGFAFSLKYLHTVGMFRWIKLEVSLRLRVRFKILHMSTFYLHIVKTATQA